jgi:hypothetical protein
MSAPPGVSGTAAAAAAPPPPPSKSRRGRYHPGECEPTEEMYCDYDEDCHGPIDSRENRQEFPDQFVWSCCGATSRKWGCTLRPERK